MSTLNKRAPIKTICIPYYLNLGVLTEILNCNLRLLDGHLPFIWKEALKINEHHPNLTLSQLAKILEEINPCGYDDSLLPILYSNRLKRVLASSLMGMNNTEVYNGTLTPSGGYIVVKDGEKTLVFNDYNWQKGLDLLMKNTFVL